jgi:hypothetical protein
LEKSRMIPMTFERFFSIVPRRISRSVTKKICQL